MNWYRILQPILVETFKTLAGIAKHVPVIRDRTRKLWLTADIRIENGRPAFFAIDRTVFEGKKPIWIHAASGEFEYAKPVIREIAKSGLGPVLVTYFSPTYRENVRKFPGVAASCPLPLDSAKEIEEFLNYLDPRAFLIARTDAWPNTVYAVRRRGVPSLLFSATFHEDSSRLKGLSRNLTIETLKRIDMIQCVAEDDVSTLKGLGLSNAVKTGDTRYDQVLSRLAEKKPLPPKLTQVLKERRFVAGSVWREDLAPVLHASKATRDAFDHTLVLVPHELSEEFLKEIESHTKDLQTARLSQLEASDYSINRKLDILIVDRIGILAELYSLAAIAFVGGSFRKSVHSVMEPLAAGCLTVVGPHHKNNREAVEFQSLRFKPGGISFVTMASNAKDMVQVLRNLWETTAQQNCKAAIEKAVDDRGGATEDVIHWIIATDSGRS